MTAYKNNLCGNI